jgi:hypothetical protein
MKSAIKITNKKKFNQTVNEVDVSDLTCKLGYANRIDRFEGYIDIETKPVDENGCGEHVWAQGEHGCYDFEDEYGFELIKG